MMISNNVILREIELSESELLYKWFNDREIISPLGLFYPRAKDIIEKQLTKLREDPNNRVFGIQSKDKKLIGIVSLQNIDWKNRNAMLGIYIGEKKYWGKGYGRDAVKTLLDFAFKEMNLNKICLRVHDYSKKAIRCYQKCGFKEEGRLREEYFHDGKYHDVIYMGILRKEFKKRQS